MIFFHIKWGLHDPMRFCNVFVCYSKYVIFEMATAIENLGRIVLADEDVTEPPRLLLISYNGSSFAISADISPALFMLEVFFYFKFYFSFKELTCFFDIFDKNCCHIRSEILSYNYTHYLYILYILW
jgi:hypothetical protein